MARSMFEKVLGILPRTTIDKLAVEFAGNEKPWLANRSYLTTQLVSCDTAALRAAALDYVQTALSVRR